MLRPPVINIQDDNLVLHLQNSLVHLSLFVSFSLSILYILKLTVNLVHNFISSHKHYFVYLNMNE